MRCHDFTNSKIILAAVLKNACKEALSIFLEIPPLKQSHLVNLPPFNKPDTDEKELREADVRLDGRIEGAPLK